MGVCGCTQDGTRCLSETEGDGAGDGFGSCEARLGQLSKDRSRFQHRQRRDLGIIFLKSARSRIRRKSGYGQRLRAT